MKLWHNNCYVFYMEQAILQKSHVFAVQIHKELIRKTIHMLIALVPSLATLIGNASTLIVLGTGILFYTYTEAVRQRGVTIPIITRLTFLASRTHENHRFVLGPITLGIGAMLALLLYPSPASVIAIYTLAFGDSVASIVGKLFGKTYIPFTGGKTLEGFLACLITAGMCCIPFTQNPFIILLLGFTAAFFELLPTKDADNIVVPTSVGLISTLVLHLIK